MRRGCARQGAATILRTASSIAPQVPTVSSESLKNADRRRLVKTGLALGAAASLPLLPGCRAPKPEPVPGDKEWRNWSGSQTSRPKAWLNPRDEAELAAQMRAAGGIRVTGASHSFSALCATDDTLFSLDQLTGIVNHDPQTLQATVWAGTRLRDLGAPMWQIGQGFSNQGDVNPQSIGGACGTSTHGTGVSLGSFSSMVRGVRLVTAEGEIIDADAEHDAEVFQACATSLGALGIVSQFRLQNRSAYKLHEREYTEPLSQVLAHLDRYARDNRHFEFWPFIESDLAVVKILNETEAPDRPGPEEDLPVTAILDLFAQLADDVPGADGPLQRLLTRLHTPVDRVGRSYDIFPSQRDSRFNEMEYEIPAARGAECLQEIIATVRKSEVRTLFPLEYRYVAADECWLSPFYQRATCAISVHQHVSVDYRPLFDLVEPIFWKYEGRPHWGKLHSLDARRLALLYPRWEDFQKVRARLDPKGKMLNAHLRKVLVP